MKGHAAVWIALAVAALLAVLAVVGAFAFVTIQGVGVHAEVQDGALVVRNSGRPIRDAIITVTFDNVAYTLPMRQLPSGETRIPLDDVATEASPRIYTGLTLTGRRYGSSVTMYFAPNETSSWRHASEPAPARTPELP